MLHVVLQRRAHPAFSQVVVGVSGVVFASRVCGGHVVDTQCNGCTNESAYENDA